MAECSSCRQVMLQAVFYAAVFNPTSIESFKKGIQWSANCLVAGITHLERKFTAANHKSCLQFVHENLLRDDEATASIRNGVAAEVGSESDGVLAVPHSALQKCKCVPAGVVIHRLGEADLGAPPASLCSWGSTDNAAKICSGGVGTKYVPLNVMNGRRKLLGWRPCGVCSSPLRFCGSSSRRSSPSHRSASWCVLACMSALRSMPFLFF